MIPNHENLICSIFAFSIRRALVNPLITTTKILSQDMLKTWRQVHVLDQETKLMPRQNKQLLDIHFRIMSQNWLTIDMAAKMEPLTLIFMLFCPGLGSWLYCVMWNMDDVGMDSVADNSGSMVTAEVASEGTCGWSSVADGGVVSHIRGGGGDQACSQAEAGWMMMRWWLVTCVHLGYGNVSE